MIGLSVVLVVAVVQLFQGNSALPPPIPNESAFRVTFNKSDTQHNVAKRAGFKHKYVDQSGGIHSSDVGGYRIEVAATYSVSDTALQKGAVIISRMTRHMPSANFHLLATHARVGIFTKAETLIVYPEYARFANPAGCGGSCGGHCATSCTGDGRKYYSLAGAGGERTAILDDNILCDSRDPYYGKSNILVHEFAHTIKLHGLTSSQISRVRAAYNYARQYRIWSDTYAMSTEEEYWAVGSSVFFNAEHLEGSAQNNDMNEYQGDRTCTSEHDCRTNIYNHDKQLYALLVEIYQNGNVNNAGNLAVCV